MGDPNLNKAIVKDLEWSPGLNRESSSWESEQATVPRQAWRLRRLWSLEILCRFWRWVLPYSSPMWCNPSLLPLGHTYDLQVGKNERERERNTIPMRIGSDSLYPDSLSFPTVIFFHGSEGAQSPRLAVQGSSTAGVLRLWCVTEQSSLWQVQISQFCSQRCRIGGFEVGPGICIKRANLRSPDGGGLWITLGEPHLCPPWWTWVDNTNLLLWTLLCSCLGMKWAIWIMEKISIHLPWVRQSLLVYFLSFPSWAREEIPNCLILYVLISSGSQIPFDDKVLCKHIHFPKASVLLNSFPMLSKRFCKEFWFILGNGSRHGWMASLTQWTWVWANSGRWWRTGKPSVLQSMGSQIVGHDWATEQQCPCEIWPISQNLS